MHYDRSLKKIIVRDMARVGKGQISDRREDLTTANVECYIYNSKTEIPTEPITPTVPTTPIINTGTVPTVPTTPTTPPPVTPTTPTVHTAPTTPVVTPTQPTIPTTPTTPVVTPTVPLVVVSQTSVNKKLSLELDNLSDIAEHFMTQDDITFSLVAKSPLKLGEVATLTLEIKDKD